ncbi:thioredoxin family protein [Patescibacteria group bacterium]|nr:thioredoxin family protein [Patescibacteria group bacterium]
MKIILPIIIVIAVIAGITIYSQDTQPSNDDVMMEKDGDVMEKNDVMMDDEGMEKIEKDGDTMMMNDDASDVMMKSGAYLDYENVNIASLEGDIVLFFHAPWCPTCRALDADINAHLGDIPGDLTIVKVDYDSNQSLKQTYGVTSQHTLVQVDQAGNKIKLWSGGNTLTSITAQI